MSPSPKDRVLAQIQHQETDPIPYTLRFEGDVEERLDAYYGGTGWRNRVDNAIQRVTSPPLGVVGDGPGDLYTDPYGSVWRVDRRPFHLVEPALKSPSLDGYSFPDLDDLFTDDWLAETLSAIEEAKDHFVVAGFSFGLFERTWALRGFDDALADAAAQPEFYEELMEAVAEHQLAIVDRLLELPVDGIMFGDDWGYQRGVLLGPERWRRTLKPRLARMYERVHTAGKYTLSHCCGSIVDIMDDLIEIGLDVLESVQPEARGMDPYQLKRDFGGRMAFWGGLGSQSTIPFGSPDEIRGEVARLCRQMGRGGGYILAPAKPLQPETPTENAVAVVEAFLEQGMRE
jgi:uroporphyrinogen decarboxylase